jgi:hypothetical protein
MGKKQWPFKQAVGYVPKYEPLEDYAEYELTCPWEHCIELMPLPLLWHSQIMSCPIFGHCCPGGVQQAQACQNPGTEIDRDG